MTQYDVATDGVKTVDQLPELSTGIGALVVVVPPAAGAVSSSTVAPSNGNAVPETVTELPAATKVGSVVGASTVGPTLVALVVAKLVIAVSVAVHVRSRSAVTGAAAADQWPLVATTKLPTGWVVPSAAETLTAMVWPGMPRPIGHTPMFREVCGRTDMVNGGVTVTVVDQGSAASPLVSAALNVSV